MKRVLVVDDEPHILRVLQLCLERAGYAVDASPDGEKALERLSEQSYDALVTDIQMPRMDGRELCEQLQEVFPERSFPVLIMTSMVDREHRHWTSEMSRVGFMEKPLSPRKLVEWLNRETAEGT